MSVIKVEQLTKDFGFGKGVFDISFEIEKGEIFGFLGPNGAGKTTAIRHILGFSKPQKGSTSVNGLDSWKEAKAIQKDLGYLPGEIAFPSNMTGIQFIKMIAEMRDLKDFTRRDELIKRFKLDPSGELKRMSKGMKQKIGIVCAFMHSPKVLVLDEPTSGLDPLMQSAFVELIAEEKAKGTTVLMSSHMIDEVEKTCDRIAIIKDGKIISTILNDDLKHANHKTFKIEFNTKESCEKFANEKFNIIDVNLKKNQIRVFIEDENTNKLVKALSKYDIKFISEIKTTLEKYFLKFYQGESNVQ